jgi:hypothetical protein
MSTLPTNIVGAVLQSTVMQRQVSTVRDTERAASTVDLRQQASIIDEKGSTVETTDGDTQIYSDAEGTGSQGRPFTPEEQKEEPAEQERTPEGDEGTILDLKA